MVREKPAPAEPSIDAGLIAYLEWLYPEHEAVASHSTDTLSFLMFEGGRRDVVRKLRALYDEQTQPTE